MSAEQRTEEPKGSIARAFEQSAETLQSAPRPIKHVEKLFAIFRDYAIDIVEEYDTSTVSLTFSDGSILSYRKTEDAIANKIEGLDAYEFAATEGGRE